MAKSKQTMMRSRNQVRQAANPLDYKKIIMDRSQATDLSRKPRDPRMVLPRMRAFVASANR